MCPTFMCTEIFAILLDREGTGPLDSIVITSFHSIFRLQVNKVLLYHKGWQPYTLAMQLTRSQRKKIGQRKREAVVHYHRRVHAAYCLVKVDMQRVT